MDSSDKDHYSLFVPLFSSAERRLRAFVYGMVPSQHDVDEIMQEVSIVLWKKFDQYEPGTEFIRWAFAVARYEVLMYRRKKARDRLCFREELLETLATEHEEESEGLAEARECLRGCLRRLPDSDREMILTVYAKNMRINELAEVIGVTPTSLYKRLNRLRSRLHDCVLRNLKTA